MILSSGVFRHTDKSSIAEPLNSPPNNGSTPQSVLSEPSPSHRRPFLHLGLHVSLPRTSFGNPDLRLGCSMLSQQTSYSDFESVNLRSTKGFVALRKLLFFNHIFDRPKSTNTNPLQALSPSPLFNPCRIMGSSEW